MDQKTGTQETSDYRACWLVGEIIYQDPAISDWETVAYRAVYAEAIERGATAQHAGEIAEGVVYKLAHKS